MSEPLYVYGLDMETHRWTKCRALPKNYGRYGCHHVQHKRMTVETMERENFELERSDESMSDGVIRMHGMTKSPARVRDELVQHDQIGVPNDEPYRVNGVPGLDAPVVPVNRPVEEKYVDCSQLPVHERISAVGTRGGNIEVDPYDDETWEWFNKDYSGTTVSMELADGRYMSITDNDDPMDVTLDTFNSMMASLPEQVPVRRDEQYDGTQVTRMGDPLIYMNHDEAYSPNNVISSSGTVDDAIVVFEHPETVSWDKLDIRMIDDTGEYAMVPVNLDMGNRDRDGFIPVHTGLMEDFLIRKSITSSSEHYDYKTGERSVDWYNPGKIAVYDSRTGQVFKATIVERGDNPGEKYEKSITFRGKYRMMLDPKVIVPKDMRIRFRPGAKNRLKQETMALGIGAVTDGEPGPSTSKY